MVSIGIGPLAFSVGQVLLGLAVAAALLAAALTARDRDQRAGHLIINAVLIGGVAARVAFVAAYHAQYRGDWLGALDIRDGGFLPLAGVLAAAAYLAWWLRRAPARRRPLATGVAVGALVWGVTAGSIALMAGTGRDLPQARLATLEGAPAQLADYRGRPLVVNLWASWCPPCRREMPVLEAAQQRHEGITFVFVNQGEDPATIRAYLESEGLDLANVLADRSRTVATQVGSDGLPTTLFYNAEGRLVDSHMGALSRA
ncbi:TlpA family protein disulfide reductase, partial [Thiohalorhabdus sp.]|uniref:TlpA family protein disulfide reductase n=1 Tax=Thiohalorhabdus sp. TaxID=3094134 RepID=UPI002FC3E010